MSFLLFCFAFFINKIMTKNVYVRGREVSISDQACPLILCINIICFRITLKLTVCATDVSLIDRRINHLTFQQGISDAREIIVYPEFQSMSKMASKL